METYKSFMIEFDRNPEIFMEESILPAIRHNARDTRTIPGIPLTPQAVRMISEITRSYIERKMQEL